MGPDRPIYLHLFDTRLDEVWTKAEVNEKLEPRLEVDITIEGQPAREVRCWLESEDGSVVTEQRVEPGNSCIKWDLRGLVDLWWPNGAGTPTRYSFNVELLDLVSLSTVKQSSAQTTHIPAIIPERQNHRLDYPQDRISSSSSRPRTSHRSTGNKLRL
jgi:beta-mannosidase